MTDKPKRKNDQPIPRRYWWIFGTLLIVLLIGLRYPIFVTPSLQMNLLVYPIISVACILTFIHFVIRFHWKRFIVVVMLMCSYLAFVYSVEPIEGYVFSYEVSCTTELRGILRKYHCQYTYMAYRAYRTDTHWADYIGILSLPILLRTDIGW